MLQKRSRVVGALLACGAILTACASSGGTTDPDRVIPVYVENDLRNPGDVTVRLLQSNGATTFLGGAAPRQRRMFAYRGGSLSGTFQLTAETGDGRTFESRPFTLFPGTAVIWSLRLNDLRVVAADLAEEPRTDADGDASR